MNAPGAVAAFVVHFLWQGFTLCMKDGTPDTWPQDHRWVSAGDERLVTCPACRAELDRRRARGRT